MKSDPEAFRRALLDHFDHRRRPLPWRMGRTPYRVMVSEFMLQQTRAETVIPYYDRWLRRFPGWDALADASADDVMLAWKGLGYYRRAQNLHRTATIVRERYDGRLPEDPAELRTLPGVGEYTAGAVASIAFGHPVPAVDGNVKRVLSRLMDVGDPTAALLRDEATRLLDPERSGDFNEAMMELGATVCTPRVAALWRLPGETSLQCRQGGHGGRSAPGAAAASAPAGGLRHGGDRAGRRVLAHGGHPGPRPAPAPRPHPPHPPHPATRHRPPRGHVGVPDHRDPSPRGGRPRLHQPPHPGHHHPRRPATPRHLRPIRRPGRPPAPRQAHIQPFPRDLPPRSRALRRRLRRLPQHNLDRPRAPGRLRPPRRAAEDRGAANPPPHSPAAWQFHDNGALATYGTSRSSSIQV